ncbi:MAG: GNAT family N-acetyltransferase [Acidobacteriota bacterium]
MDENIEIRELTRLAELAACVDLQRAVFALPEVELSPVRHFIVTINAGGFVLGAYSGSELIGFVLSVPAFLRGEKAFYSHMTAVRADFQSHGIGARLKWKQREKSLDLGVRIIKWTFEPVKARNAYFNLEKLGAFVSEYQENFYGTDYTTTADTVGKIGLASDRLFAEWHLESPKVQALVGGNTISEQRDPDAIIFIVDDWLKLVEADPKKALEEQVRVRHEFKAAFEQKFVGRQFMRAWDDVKPAYLLYKD